jgi:hypothetical protein
MDKRPDRMALEKNHLQFSRTTGIIFKNLSSINTIITMELLII